MKLCCCNEQHAKFSFIKAELCKSNSNSTQRSDADESLRFSTTCVTFVNQTLTEILTLQHSWNEEINSSKQERSLFKSFKTFLKSARRRHSPLFFHLSLVLFLSFNDRVCAALRDFNCHIETICIFCHMVLRTANGKSVEFLASQSAQALAWLPAS